VHCDDREWFLTKKSEITILSRRLTNQKRMLTGIAASDWWNKNFLRVFFLIFGWQR